MVDLRLGKYLYNLFSEYIEAPNVFEEAPLPIRFKFNEIAKKVREVKLEDLPEDSFPEHIQLPLGTVNPPDEGEPKLETSEDETTFVQADDELELFLNDLDEISKELEDNFPKTPREEDEEKGE